MDRFTEYIWERRLHHSVTYRKRDVLFPESVQLGLEFNAALEKKEKLDVSLLTNAVVLELWDFAKCVTGSGAQFLFEILEFNFDLGVNGMSKVQYFDFRKTVHIKAKLMRSTLRTKQEKWKETFTLPQLVDEKALVGSEQRETNRDKTFDVSLLTSGSTNSWSSENQKMESDGGDGFFEQRGGAPSKLTDDSFPRCKELGVKMFIQEENAPKEKLHTDRLTKGVMMELLSFSRVLCGIRSGIVCDLVKLNFGQELNKTLFYSRVNKIMERKRLCLKEEDRDAFRKEPFLSQSNKQTKLKKRKNPDIDYQEVEGLVVPSRRRSSLRDSDCNGTEMCQDRDLSYMCPVDFEAEMLSDTETEQENTASASCPSETCAETMFAATEEETTAESAEKNVAAAEETQVAVEERTSEATEETALEVVIKEEEEEVYVFSGQPQVKSPDSQLPDVHCESHALTAVSDLFSADKHQGQNVKSPQQRFWMRRAFRTQQILRTRRVTDRFASCRVVGLDFNVGSGRRQKLSLQLFTNSVMCEVYRFASSMQKSLHSFLCEILENNFNVRFQDEAQQRYFVTTMVSREKAFQSHPARRTAEFCNSFYTVQESSYTVDVESGLQTWEIFGEQQEELDSATSAATEQEDSDPHPFCRKIGLDLWSTEPRPASRKLDLLALTKGAVMEMIAYIRYMCGNVRKTIVDILEHNFDLDLQDPMSNDRKTFEKWYYKHRNVMPKCSSSKKKTKWLKQLVYVHPASQYQHQPTFDITPEDPDAEDSTLTSKGNVAKQRGSSRACEEIGLHLSLGTKPKTRKKLHLGVLTRRLLFEIHQYVMRNSMQYIPALYQILENNFDLSSQSHRRVEFAWAVSSQVLGIVRKVGRKGSYLDKAVVLPLELPEHSQVVCKEEPENNFTELDRCENSDIVFLQELKPVDIEIEIE